MSVADPPELTAGAQRALAAQLFNRTWELLGSARSPVDDPTMLACALASDRYATAARRTLETVDDAEDRELVAGQLASIPGLPDE